MTDMMPWQEVPPLEPVSSGELVVSALEALLSAAALHMGKLMPDGRGLAEPDPMEAWIALLGASALYMQLAPLFDAEATRVYREQLVTLFEQFAAEHPGLAVPAPGADMAGMLAATQATWEVFTTTDTPADAAPKTAELATKPPTALPELPKRGTGSLPPLRGTGKLPSVRKLT